MAWNGSGVFNRVHNWVADRDAAIDITASRMDAEQDGIATGITACLAKNGENAATANLPMGGFKHTGVGNSAARNDYAATGQVQDSSFTYVADTGAADAYAMTLAPAITAYATGQVFTMKAANTNTGASTLNVNSVGVKSIVDAGNNALTAGAIVSGQFYTMRYDGTSFRLLGASVPIACKTVTDTTDISLGDIASTQSNFGSSFTATIPTGGLIRLTPIVRLQSDSAAATHMVMGIRISSTNYWPRWSDNGATSYTRSMGGPSTSGQYYEGFGELGENWGGLAQGLDIAKNSIPTGSQTIQLVVARANANTATIKGTAVTSRAFIEIMDGT